MTTEHEAVLRNMLMHKYQAMYTAITTAKQLSTFPFDVAAELRVEWAKVSKDKLTKADVEKAIRVLGWPNPLGDLAMSFHEFMDAEAKKIAKAILELWRSGLGGKELDAKLYDRVIEMAKANSVASGWPVDMAAWTRMRIAKGFRLPRGVPVGMKTGPRNGKKVAVPQKEENVILCKIRGDVNIESTPPQIKLMAATDAELIAIKMEKERVKFIEALQLIWPAADESTAKAVVSGKQAAINAIAEPLAMMMWSGMLNSMPRSSNGK